MVQKINRLLAGTALCSALLLGTVQAAEIQTNMARMQAMDKVTGKVSEIDVPINGETVFGTFSIVVRYCATRSPEETPENFAFVDVVDNYNGDNPVNVFKGWMLSSSPALSAVEHPIYDVWLLKCYDGDATKHKLLSAEQLKLRDETAKAIEKEDQLSVEAQKAIADQTKAEELKVSIPEAPALPTAEENAAAPQEPTIVPQEITAAMPEIEEQLIMEPAEAGAPQPLFGLQNAVETPTEIVPAEAPAPQAEPLPVAAEEVNAVVNIPEPATVLPEVASSMTIDEVVNEAEHIDESEDVVPTIMTEPAPSDGLLITPPEENQLIRFEDEVEEDSFDMDTEALSN